MGGGGSTEFCISSFSTKAAVFFLSYFFMPKSKLSAVNLFDLKFSACLSFSNRTLFMSSLNSILPLKSLIGCFVFVFPQQGMLKGINVSLEW